WLEAALRHRRLVIVAVAAIFISSLGLLKFIGTEFFPETDEGQFRVIVRNPVGTRIELTEEVIKSIERAVYQTIPKEHLVNVTANIGAAQTGSGNFYSTNTGPHSGYVDVELVGSGKRSI